MPFTAAKAERRTYSQYVLHGLVYLGGRPDSRRSGQAQDLWKGHGGLLFFFQLDVLVLLLQEAHHDVVVDVSFLSVVTLVYDDQSQICTRQKRKSSREDDSGTVEPQLELTSVQVQTYPSILLNLSVREIHSCFF